MTFSDEELDSFSVTIHPKSQKVMEGSPIVLTCISSLRTYTEFQWKIGFKPVTSDHERRHGSDEKGMHIHQTADNMSVLRIDVSYILRELLIKCFDNVISIDYIRTVFH